MRTRFVAALCSALLFLPPSAPAHADTPPGAEILAGCEPAKKGNYPFDPQRISDAYERLTKSQKAQEVWVVIGDNGFVGYEQDTSGKRSGVNFSDAFFHSESDTEYLPADPLTALEADGVKAEQWGHGTHVAGLVLGGDYGVGQPDVQRLDLALPSVRRLLFRDKGVRVAPTDQPPDSWLKMFVMGLANDSGVDLNTFRLAALPTSLQRLKEKSLNTPDIINLSLVHHEVSGSYDGLEGLPTDLPKTLWVASAGNDSNPLTSGNGARFPAMATQGLGNLIVVGSHDSNMEPSSFSNYERTIVTIAAPGCAIRSWIAASGAATPLSGTSQAAALVTFAAALLKSRWPLVGAAELRERLIVSSRYSAALATKCSYKVGSKELVGCTRYGSALDIEVALNWNTDFIEFCANGGDLAVNGCETTSLIGTLEAVPEALVDCAEAPVSVDNKSGLSRPAAIRFTGLETVGGAGDKVANYQMLWRVKKPGLPEESLQGKSCGAAQGMVVFKPDGVQPNGATQGPTQPMPMSRVVRIVTRSR